MSVRVAGKQKYAITFMGGLWKATEREIRANDNGTMTEAMRARLFSDRRRLLVGYDIRGYKE